MSISGCTSSLFCYLTLQLYIVQELRPAAIAQLTGFQILDSLAIADNPRPHLRSEQQIDAITGVAAG